MNQANHSDPMPVGTVKPSSQLQRREVLRLATAVGATWLGWGVLNRGYALDANGVAKPAFLVPEDKNLSPLWLKSLTERGAPRICTTKTELHHIGMPIGGIGAGQLYLSGDGRLWLWDIFNQHRGTSDGAYARPMVVASPFDQGFAIAVKTGSERVVRRLDSSGFQDITFRGQYPLGLVAYKDPAVLVEVALTAFSPFIPLATEDSALPATIMEFTVANKGDKPVEVDLFSWLPNTVCSREAGANACQRLNQVLRSAKLLYMSCGIAAPTAAGAAPRASVVFADFEGPTWPAGWTTEGTAFGSQPRGMPNANMTLKNQQGNAVATSFAGSDQTTGKLISPTFTIQRNFISFLLGGGKHPNEIHVDLLVDGKVVRTATGHGSDTLREALWDVREFAGKKARIEAVDAHTDDWGHIDLDYIRFHDDVLPPGQDTADLGTMGLGLVGSEAGDWAVADVAGSLEDILLAAEKPAAEREKSVVGANPRGAIGRHLSLAAGASATVTFLVSWHFPNLRIVSKDPAKAPDGRRYMLRFKDANGVAAYIAKELPRLSEQTRLFHRTWYEDATLPWWFLDRTLANVSILATNTCFWFASGRMWAWEGVGCCDGTCTHVWQYAHSVARLFPDLERGMREMQDFSVGYDDASGSIRIRGENQFWAADGQAGVILRSLREHQMSADDGFLRRNWPKIKHALEFLINEDKDKDGLLEGKQHNTLDTDWYGPVAWLSSLYIAALRAGQAMATEMGDGAFATLTKGLAESGSRKLASELFNGEYFINKPDPNHTEAMNSGNGCEIDQVFGQSWAFQIGLPRIIPVDKTLSALKYIWRYNFAPDVGPYRATFQGGRVYAVAGEAGLLMCTWPSDDRFKYKGKSPDWAFNYFNECMSGFEHQVAGHMVWEGMLTEGLAVIRAVHDRYDAAKRNPWNEVECGDHYARAMASHGVYLAVCGYEYHGPRGHLGFAPRVRPEDFRAAFSAAEGWGSFSQKYTANGLSATLEVRYGQLRLKTLALQLPPGKTAKSVSIKRGTSTIGASITTTASGRVLVNFSQINVIKAGTTLLIQLQ